MLPGEEPEEEVGGGGWGVAAGSMAGGTISDEGRCDEDKDLKLNADCNTEQNNKRTYLIIRL